MAGVDYEMVVSVVIKIEVHWGKVGIEVMGDTAFACRVLDFLGLGFGFRGWVVFLFPKIGLNVDDSVLDAPWGSSCEYPGSGPGVCLKERNGKALCLSGRLSVSRGKPDLVRRGAFRAHGI